MTSEVNVAVVGGGLAGLTAAIHAARTGARVTLIERVSELGGRARTREDDGFAFNMGPHALYRQAEGMAVLDELGIEVDGAAPPLSGAGARLGGRLHALPGGLVSLLTTGLLRPAEKVETARFLASLPRLDTRGFDDRSLADVLQTELRHPKVRMLVEALGRLSSYAHAPDLVSGGATLAQLQRALRGGVLYLHGGWGRLVASLRELALQRGVELRAGAGVRSVRPEGRGFTLTLQRGPEGPIAADAVVLAVPPAETARLLAESSEIGATLARMRDTLVPARAASLEIGLSRLPFPKSAFTLGIDEPTYFSVHSNTARLAPEGGALIHCTRYLAPDEAPTRDVLAKELEAVVDQAQPGWRDHIVHRQLLTDLTVSFAITPRGGLSARPPVAVKGARGLLLAGDWVGSAGMLADAALASGREAGRAAGRAAKEPPSA